MRLKMKLIDTNIFIYAVGRPHAHKEKSLRLVKDVLTRPSGYNINVEILQEIIHLYISRKEREKGLNLIESILDMFPQPFSVTSKDIKVACFFLKKYPEINTRDSIHAAIVKNYRLEGIVTYDKHFEILTEIKVFRP